MVHTNTRERDEVLTVEEACRILRVGRTRFYELKKKGRLAYFRQGSRVMLWRSDCERYLRSLPVIKAGES